MPFEDVSGKIYLGLNDPSTGAQTSVSQRRKSLYGGPGPLPQAAPPGTVTPGMPDGMNPMVGVKLWQNPCRLLFRVNFIAHHFNHPIYEWIDRCHQLTAPEHVVLFAIGLREGIAAEDVAASSSRPRNTLSRAINRLLSRQLIRRTKDPEDRRRLLLYLTDAGRRVLDETVPQLVARQDLIFSSLSAEERETLNYLMTKVILNQATWPPSISIGPSGISRDPDSTQP